jgi:hypothetical protein
MSSMAGRLFLQKSEQQYDHPVELLTLTKNVTIDGAALSSRLTLSGNVTQQIFRVSTPISVTLNGLNLTGSFGDGSVLVNDGGTITIRNSALYNNDGWGSG